MSTEPTIKLPTPIEDRRRHLRRKVDDLAYVDCGSDNGGILLDVGEDGLSFQGIAALTVGTILEVRFVLPGLASAIEASGEVVWSTDSRRCGGVRFVNLQDSAQQQIRQWVSAGANSLNRKADTPPEPRSFVAPVSSVNLEPQRTEGLFAIPATLPSGSPVQDAPDLPPASGGQAMNYPQTARTMFADGLRRIHSVRAASQDAQREKVPAARAPEDDSTQPVVLGGVPERSSRAWLYVVGAALGCLIVIAGVVIGFRAQRSSGAAAAGNGAAVAPASAEEANRNFQVEVLDIHNRRLVLSNNASAAGSGYGAAGTQSVGSQNLSGGGIAKPPAAPLQTRTAATSNRSLQDLTLKTPSRLNRSSSLAVPQEPVVAAGVAPPIASLGTPFVVTEAPNQPLPPQAPAVILPPKSGLQQAVLIKRVEPVFSAFARQAHASGIVQVRAVIGTDGVPRALRFVSGDARLASPALDAIRLWRYRPALLDGQAIETEALVQIEFRLQQ